VSAIPPQIPAAAPKLSMKHEILVRPGHVSGPLPRHMQGMAQPIYNVFLRHDGSYGVALSQLGAMVRTATGFAAAADAREWIEKDRLLEEDGRSLQLLEPAIPRAY
jgi:hypothetical protein